MPIKITETAIAAVQKKHPDVRSIPANSARITSWYRKSEIQPWIKSIEDWEPMKDELVCGDFVQAHNIEFASKKGETPEGTKVFYLTEGVYMGKIFADVDDKKGTMVFYAVTDKGKSLTITGDQASELAAEANGKTFKKSQGDDDALEKTQKD
ncbi:MAG: hypothetical protein LBK71_12280 [Verrucomicrobiales bacterium]|jgi:hypothetical protein|nr:hypothetical protein [Verrucomicrobiales bacterium]